VPVSGLGLKDADVRMPPIIIRITIMAKFLLTFDGLAPEGLL